MNSFKRCSVIFAISATLTLGVVAEVQAGASASGALNRNSASDSNPYNSPIRRANPNSRQGTESGMPPNRGTLQTNPRPPSLENGGIGNGYPTRDPAARTPSSRPSSVPNR